MSPPSVPLHVVLLGQPRVVGPQGTSPPAALGGTQGTRALVYLWWERGRPVPRHELASVLWGDDLPGSWPGALRSIVSRARRALRDAGAPADALTAVGGCYLLVLSEDSTADVTDAREAWLAAQRATEQGDFASAHAHAQTAHDLLTPDLLPGDDSPWAVRVRVELEDDRLAVAELLAGAALRIGRAAEVPRIVERGLARNPLRESLHRLVMESHLASGNRAAALRAYEVCRRLLVDELGISPGPEVQDLYQQLLRDEVVDAAATSPPIAPPASGDPLADRPDVYRSAFLATAVGMAFVGMDRRMVAVNPALEELLGRSAEEIAALGIDGITHPEDRLLHVDVHTRLLRGEIDRYQLDKRYIHRDGRVIWAALEVAAVRDGSGAVEMLFSQVHDITDRVTANERLTWAAFHDPVTGLPNRWALAERLDASLAGGEAAVGLVVVGVRGLADINATHGRGVGDTFLSEAASRVRNAVGSTVVVARVATDELAVVPPVDDVRVVAGTVLGVLDAAFWFGAHRLDARPAAGVAAAARVSSGELLRRAELALRHASSGPEAFPLAVAGEPT